MSISAGIAGGIMSLFGNKVSQSTQHKYNEYYIDKQNSYNAALTAAQNRYNSPANQRALLAAADMNPDLAYGNANIQPMSGIPSASPSQQIPVTNYGEAVRLAFDGIESTYRSVRAQIENNNLQKGFDLQYGKLSSEIDNLEQTTNNLKTEGAIKEHDLKLLDSIRNSTWFTSDGKSSDFYELQRELYKMGVDNEMSQLLYDKSYSDKLIQFIDQIIAGDVNAKNLISTSFDREVWSLEQDKAFSKILDKFADMGEFARMLSTIARYLLK